MSDEETDNSDDQLYEIDYIVVAKVVLEKTPRSARKAWSYLVRWAGCGSDEDTWEPSAKFSTGFLREFWKSANGSRSLGQHAPGDTVSAFPAWIDERMNVPSALIRDPGTSVSNEIVALASRTPAGGPADAHFSPAPAAVPEEARPQYVTELVAQIARGLADEQVVQPQGTLGPPIETSTVALAAASTIYEVQPSPAASAEDGTRSTSSLDQAIAVPQSGDDMDEDTLVPFDMAMFTHELFGSDTEETVSVNADLASTSGPHVAENGTVTLSSGQMKTTEQQSPSSSSNSDQRCGQIDDVDGVPDDTLMTEPPPTINGREVGSASSAPQDSLPRGIPAAGVVQTRPDEARVVPTAVSEIGPVDDRSEYLRSQQSGDDDALPVGPASSQGIPPSATGNEHHCANSSYKDFVHLFDPPLFAPTIELSSHGKAPCADSEPVDAIPTTPPEAIDFAGVPKGAASTSLAQAFADRNTEFYAFAPPSHSNPSAKPTKGPFSRHKRNKRRKESVNRRAVRRSDTNIGSSGNSQLRFDGTEQALPGRAYDAPSKRMPSRHLAPVPRVESSTPYRQARFQMFLRDDFLGSLSIAHRFHPTSECHLPDLSDLLKENPRVTFTKCYSVGQALAMFAPTWSKGAPAGWLSRPTPRFQNVALAGFIRFILDYDLVTIGPLPGTFLALCIFPSNALDLADFLDVSPRLQGADAELIAVLVEQPLPGLHIQNMQPARLCARNQTPAFQRGENIVSSFLRLDLSTTRRFFCFEPWPAVQVSHLRQLLARNGFVQVSCDDLSLEVVFVHEAYMHTLHTLPGLSDLLARRKVDFISFGALDMNTLCYATNLLFPKHGPSLVTFTWEALCEPPHVVKTLLEQLMVPHAPNWHVYMQHLILGILRRFERHGMSGRGVDLEEGEVQDGPLHTSDLIVQYARRGDLALTSAPPVVGDRAAVVDWIEGHQLLINYLNNDEAELFRACENLVRQYDDINTEPGDVVYGVMEDLRKMMAQPCLRSECRRCILVGSENEVARGQTPEWKERVQGIEFMTMQSLSAELRAS